MKLSITEQKKKNTELAKLRQQRDSFLDKARECVVYNDAAGYRFWLQAANDISNKIMALNVPDGPKTARKIEEGYLIVSLRKRAVSA